MNIRKNSEAVQGVRLCDYIEMKRGERAHSHRYIESGVFMYEGHVYCIVGSTGAGCDLKISHGYVGLFNLKSQTIRQVTLDSVVIPVGAEIIIAEETNVTYPPTGVRRPR